MFKLLNGQNLLQKNNLRTRILIIPLVMVLLFGVYAALPAHAAGESLSTNKADYYSGETVSITGTGFSLSTTVFVVVARPDSTTDSCTSGQSWRLSPCNVSGGISSDGSGGLAAFYQLDGIYGTYTITASYDGVNVVASTSFTDADIDFTQCRNDSDNNQVKDDCEWTTGSINQINGVYIEGDAVPQRLFHRIDTAGTHTFEFTYEFSKGNEYAYDFLTNVDQTQSGALLNECGNLAGFVSGSLCASLYSGALTPSIPSDSFDAVAAREHPASRVIRIGGVTSASVTIVGHVPSTACFQTCGDSDTTVDVTFTTASANQIVGLWFAGHLAQGADPDAGGPLLGWGTGFGAGSVSGAPFHFKYQTLDGASVGNRDNQVQIGAVIPPPIVSVSCPAKGTTGKKITCTASVVGGQSPFTFSWSAPGGSPSIGTGTSFSVTYGAPGTYFITVTVTDFLGQTNSATTSVDINPQPKTLTVTCSSATVGKPVTCTAISSGGFPPITFDWSAPGGNPASGSGANFTTTYATKGNYNITVTQHDGDGLTVTRIVPVSVSPQPIVVTVNCSDGTAGKPITCAVSATGGTSPYSGTGNFTVTEPVKGTFTETFTVTDANGRSASGSDSVVIAPQPFVVRLDCPDTGLTAGKPFTCSVSGTGGTSPYIGSTNVTRTEPVKGSFTERACLTDSNGVESCGTVSVTIAPQPIVVNVDCPNGGVTAGKAFKCTVSATGGTSPYSGTGSFMRTEPVKGAFIETFTVTDANDRSASGSDTVTVAPQPLVVTVVCSDGTSGKPLKCDVSATGGTAPYLGTGSFSVTEPVKGSFNECFVVTDGNGVSASGCDSVTIAPQPIVVTVVCSDGTSGKPIKCDVSATGGTAPYSGTGSFSVTEPVKGTFTETFTVTDANGRSASGSDSVVIAPQPLVVTVVCSDGTSGKPLKCDVSATGGTAPYTGTGSFTVIEPVKGTFNECFVVRDANGISATGCDSVVIAPQPLIVTVVCSDGTSGKPLKCDVSATGGTAPYTGTGGFTVIEPVKGTFNECFVVTDGNGVSATGCDSVVIAPQPFVVRLDCPDIGLTAGKPFKCTVSGSGGTSPYFGDTNVSFTEPVKATFPEKACLIDSNNVLSCGTDTVVIKPQPLVITATCSDGTVGKVIQCDSSATGGTAPYTFLWDVGKDGTTDGQGQKFRTAFPVKGTFSIDAIVVDANDATAFVNLPIRVHPQPLIITASCQPGATAGKPLQCNASATGGTEPYVFTWDVGKDGIIDGTGPKLTTSFANKGTFSIDAIVTDANGASARINITVVIAPQPLTAHSCPTTGTAGKPVVCEGTANGGTAPYLFRWDVGKDGVIDGNGPVFTWTFPVKGTFSIDEIVVDANNATLTMNFEIVIAPQPLVVTVDCPNGGVTAGKPFFCSVTATGGTAPYSGVGNFTRTEPVKGTFTETFTVTDANGRSASGSDSVTVAPQPLVITAACQPGTAGKLIICHATASGGTAPYSFAWDVGKDGTTDGQGSGLIHGELTFFNTIFAVKGSYSIDAIVTDANGARAFVNLPVIVRPQPLVITAGCQPGTAGKPTDCSASASGGTTPYTFLWDVGKDGNIDGQGAGFTAVFPVKGTFSIDAIVIDNNNATASVNLSFRVEPQPLVITAGCSPGTAGKPTDCNASASGGTAPYRFLWDVGKDGAVDGSGETFTTVFPVKGTFSIDAIVVDINNATAFVNLLIIVRPQPLVITASCSGSAVGFTTGKPINCQASASGGTQPYTFLWDFGKDGTIQGEGQTFTTVIANKGTFSIDAIVRDANNATAFVNLPIIVRGQPLVITAECFPGTAGKPTHCTASASGGTAPYAFSWDVGKDGLIDGQGSGFAPIFPIKGDFSIDAIVRDGNDATARVNLSFHVSGQPLVITASCSSGTSGKPIGCQASASGGTGPYQFAWDKGKDGTIDGLGPTFTTIFPIKGTFTIDAIVKDANLAVARVNIPVTIRGQPLMVDFTGTCVADHFGQVTFTATVTGGTVPYAFSWNFGDSSTGTGNPVTHTYASAGSFTVTVTVTDANGSTATKTKGIVACGNKVTDTSFCPLPNDGFRIIYITDPANPTSYKLTATNPGQFYDNIFNAGTPGDPVTLTITIPFPFVTQGAFPIQVSSSVSLVNGCFLPSFDLNGQFTITTTGGNLSPSGHPVILLSDYSPQNLGSTTTVTVSGFIPASGLVYVTIHLEYGLKGTTGWAKGLLNSAVNSGLGITIADPQSYTFSFADGGGTSTSVQSHNVFKKDPGFAGIVVDSNGFVLAGAVIRIYDARGVPLGMTTTDNDGVYLFFYKYTGPKATFTVRATYGATTLTQTVILQSNKIVVANFTFLAA